MNVQTICTAATLVSFALLPALVGGCGSPPEEHGQESQSGLIVGGGGGVLDGPPVIHCGSSYSFDTSDSFQWALSYLGCQSPRHAFPWSGAYYSVALCPSSQFYALQAQVDEYAQVAPIYSMMRTSGGTTCSNYTTPMPGGWVEVTFDPNCTGPDCGSIRQ